MLKVLVTVIWEILGECPVRKTHLTGCIGEIMVFYETPDDKKTLNIHEYLMKKWRITNTIVSY